MEIKEIPSVLANGHTIVRGYPLRATADWRRQGMELALLNSVEDGTPWMALIAVFQHQYPEQTVFFLREARERVLQSLEKRLNRLESLLAPAFHLDNEKSKDMVFGWWQGELPDSGERIEIALSPGTYGSGEWILCGPNKAVVEWLVDRIVEDAARNHTCRCLRYSGGEWEDAPEIEEEVQRISWDDIVLAPTQWEDIRNTIDTFFTQKDLFHRLGFAWRRGLLLIGPPGTGKTMICKAAAHTRPELPFLYVRDMIPPHRHDALTEIFSFARRVAPCILALEDMDGMVGQGNRTLFLNELDGFNNNDGLLIIASSNHPERIDEALLKRPSRFDCVYHIGLPENAERAEYCRRILAKSPMPVVLEPRDQEILISQMAATSDGFTPAFLKEALLSAMLSAAQNGKEQIDETFTATVLDQIRALKTYLKKAKNPEAFAEMTAATGNEIGFRTR